MTHAEDAAAKMSACDHVTIYGEEYVRVHAFPPMMMISIFRRCRDVVVGRRTHPRRRVLLGDSGGKPDPQVFPPASSSIVLIYVGKVL